MKRDDAWEWLNRIARRERVSRRIREEVASEFGVLPEDHRGSGIAETMSDEDLDSALNNYIRLLRF